MGAQGPALLFRRQSCSSSIDPPSQQAPPLPRLSLTWLEAPPQLALTRGLGDLLPGAGKQNYWGRGQKELRSLLEWNTGEKILLGR